MLFEKFFQQNFPNKWVRCNAQYFLVGILIGTFINIIFRMPGGYNMSWKDILMTYLVSIIITLCITNISLISEGIIKVKFSSPVVNVIINYGLLFIGVIIGTELSMLCVSLLYDVPFGEIDQEKNLHRNLVLGFLVGTLVYIYQLQRHSYDLKINEKELQVAKLNELKTTADLKALQARINPHFLYNAFNSITSLIHDQPQKAEEMTIKLSQLFRYSINTQESNWASVKEELNVVNTYLDIERVRFGNRISFSTQADDSVQNIMIPRFLLQPLVENALKHGLKNKSDGGELKILIKGDKQTVLIYVYDNGVAFPDDMLAGYGLQSTYDKLNLLYGSSWKMKFNNLPEKHILIEIPGKTEQ